MEALWGNTVFWSALAGWTIAQITKMICFLVTQRRFMSNFLFSTGGMPSAHSAMAAALTTAVGLRCGLQDPLFAVATAFAIVVMFDAQSVRRAAGTQARILNQIISELFRNHRLSEKRLVELLGHTRLEVFMGLTIGVLSALITHSLMNK